MLLKSQRLTKHLGLWITLILLFSGLLFRLSGDIKLGDSVLLIGAGSGLGWAITWLFTRETITKPLRSLLSAA